MCWPIGAVGLIGCGADVVGAIADTGMSALADSVAEGVGVTAASLGTAWMLVPSPILVSQQGQSATAVEFVRETLWIVTVALMLVSIIVVAVRLGWEQRGEPLTKLVTTVLTYVVVSTGGMTFLAMVVTAMDALAMAVVQSAVRDSDFGRNVLRLLAMDGGMGVLLTIVMGFFAIIVALLQSGTMVVRWALVPIVAGVWPSAAAFLATAVGERWFKRMTSWLFALAFYKLAASIVYGTGFRLSGSNVFEADTSGLLSLLTGVVIMVLALAALPALVRLIAPAVDAVGSGGSGAMLAGAAAGIASGAINAGMLSRGGRGSGGGSDGADGAQGPSGAIGGGVPGGSRATGSSANPRTGPEGSQHSGSADGANEGDALRERADSAGPTGASTPEGATTAGAAPSAGAGSATGAGAAAGGGGTAAGGAAAATGPAGIAASAAIQGAQAVNDAVKNAAEEASGPAGAGPGDRR